MQLDQRWHWFRPHLLPLFLIVLAIYLSYPGLSSHEAYGFDDLSRLNIPQRLFAANTWRHGQIPLWNPYNFGGQPFLAAGQAGALYFPNVVYLLFPIEAATKISYGLHALLAAFGMYALMYHLDKRKTGAFVSSISFVTCGFLVGHQVHTQMFDAFCWLPLLTLILLKLIENPTFTRVCTFSFAFAGEIYAGHPQITFFITLFLCLYTCGHLALIRNHHDSAWKIVRYVILAVVLSFGLSASQWLPTLDLAHYSSRQHAGALFLLSGSLPPAGLTQFLNPFFSGGGLTNVPFSPYLYMKLLHTPVFWEFYCYVGIIVFGAALVSLLGKWQTNPAIQIFCVLFLFSMALSLGANTWLSYVLVHVPGFDLFRVPARYIGLTDFTLVVLGGFGINALTAQSHSKATMHFTLVMITSACILVCLPFIMHTSTMHVRAIFVPVAICVALAVTTMLAKRQFSQWIGYFIPIAAVIDCIIAASSFSPFVLARTAPYQTPSPQVSFLINQLQHDGPFTRVMAMPDTSLAQDASVAYNIPTINGYDSLVPDWYAQYIGLTWSIQTIENQPNRIFHDLNVKYMVTRSVDSPESTLPHLYNGDKWVAVSSGPTETVWENPDLFQPAWIVSKPAAPNSNMYGGVHLSDFQINRSVWDVQTKNTGWIVISQMFDSGWSASLDNRPTPLRRIDGFLTGVQLGVSGHHTLILRYEPKSFRNGSWLTLATATTLLLSMMFQTRQRKFWRRRSGSMV